MGVKSLWQLLTPAGRPVRLETMEGKSMAIDSSIWIYQFQATMRDKDGRVLVNAHVVGFLRRLCKLLFYGIKPVFVFDGGAPALKRMTISERKKKKSGAADSHARIAEKLLAAQLRREAVNQAQGSSSAKGPPSKVVLDESTVYLEDIDGTSSLPATPAKDKGKAKASPSKKSRWQDYDPYRLPDVDLEAQVQKHTRSAAPDPRLATEDELRTFIEMMRPEDLDVTSPEFRELPTEVQYEIIGDLRLKSRQTSHKRLQAMLRESRTALDFSRAQIQNLKQRNALTQQLLETTDSIGKANVTIPVRIASERNREYVLIKNEGPEGGWVLGIRDEGTQEKPILIDQEEPIRSDQENDDGSDMQEVTIAAASIGDPDMREYQREQVLSGAAKRQAVAGTRGRPQSTNTIALAPASRPKRKSKPLFMPDIDEQAEPDSDDDIEWEEIEDAEMTAATQASLAELEEQEADDLRRAVQASKEAYQSPPKTPKTTPPKTATHSRHVFESSTDSENELYIPTPSRLVTQLKFANTDHLDGVEGPTNVMSNKPKSVLLPAHPNASAGISDSDDDMEEVSVLAEVAHAKTDIPPESFDRTESVQSTQASKQKMTRVEAIVSKPTAVSFALPENVEESDEELEAVQIGSEVQVSRSAGELVTKSVEERPIQSRVIPARQTPVSAVVKPVLKPSQEAVIQSSLPLIGTPERSEPEPNRMSRSDVTLNLDNANGLLTMDSDSSEEEGESWTRPASPGLDNASGTQREAEGEGQEHWDAAEEMRPHEEETEFAHFVSQVKGKDLDSVRREIDEEIRQLNQQKKAAMRDSEDVTQAMITQIMMMLRLFGIPYITAPMEAEAQCAELVQLGLVDGIITDDSDVFLFGGLRVFKNMFNQSKTVECFLLTDLERELGLDRDKLVRLAYLLGSDYVEGLPKVGPVVAMELLKEFPGEDGLHKFKDWWSRVQMGRDTESDNVSKFRKRFKKRFKDLLYLPSDWPNPAVRDAYYHPVVDSSEEPFKWGLPDLDGLRGFLREELSWNTAKVDELLQPIIHRMNKRGQTNSTNRQGLLNDFFSVSAGIGAAEPRKRQVYTSKRLQELVTEHRKEQAKKRAQEGGDAAGSGSRKKSRGKGRAAGNDRFTPSTSTSTSTGSDKEDEKEQEEPAAKKRKKASTGESGRDSRGGSRSRGRGRTAKTVADRSKTAGKKPITATIQDSSSDEEFVAPPPSDAPVREIALRKRVRPRSAYKGVQAQAEENSEASREVNKNEKGPSDSGSDGSEYQEG